MSAEVVTFGDSVYSSIRDCRIHRTTVGKTELAVPFPRTTRSFIVAWVKTLLFAENDSP